MRSESRTDQTKPPHGSAADPAPIVVDVDGTASGRDAVAWAEAEAARRGATMHVLPKRDPERLLAECGPVSMIVIGSAGLLAMSRLMTGSAAMDVAVHADVPVVVVRPGLPDARPGPSAGRVVVGDDGTELSRAAVDFAAEEARDRGCGLTVVHAVEDRTGAADETSPASVAEAPPGTRTVFAEGRASVALIEESAGAQLLVVGSRGHAGLGGMLTGSVSQAVVHRAHCPVAVVRARR